MGKTKKVSDLCVAIGAYTDKDGIEKTQYENIGVEMETDNGRFLLIKPYINLSGFKHEPGKMILVSKFSAEQESAENQNNEGESK